MSEIFISELDLPIPDNFLNVKSNLQGCQTGRIIARSEAILLRYRPDIVLVMGDTNSALGVALATTKLGIPISYVESGCRSFDKFMSEEINRITISHIADLNFAPTKTCVHNLYHEGIPKNRIFFTGHPLIDTINILKSKLTTRSTIFNTSPQQYVLATVHRRENIAEMITIKRILKALDDLAGRFTVIFPCHPHTRRQIRSYGLQDQLKNIKLLDPVGYLDSLSLIMNSRFVLTDSGGIQQEAAIMGTPCVTIRERTEWTETVQHGINFIAGTDPRKIVAITENIERQYRTIKKRLAAAKYLYGKLGVSKRIVKIMTNNKIT